MKSPALRWASGGKVAGSPPVLLDSYEVTGTDTSVTLGPVPTGYGELILIWDDVQGDDNTIRNIQMTLVSGAGGYDYSLQAFGTASSTTNAADFIVIGITADDDGIDAVSSGQVRIFNRSGQEKVVIGTTAYFDNSAGGGADDLVGSHCEGKDRNTSAEISSVTVAPAAGNFDAGKFYLVGILCEGEGN